MSDDFFEKSLSFEEIREKSDRFILNLFNRAPISFRFGQGEYLFDSEGKQYLDFLCGISVTNLGHGEADIVETIRDQAEKIIHSSNLFYIEQQAKLAEVLISYSFPGQVFFTNSGTESNEAAFKLARSFGQQAKNGATLILSLEGSFHGRTVAGMCMTAQEKIHGGFGPLLDDHVYLPANDIDLLEKTFAERGQEMCAFILEPIQGEGGIHVMEKEYIHRARELCTEYNVLLIFDEIQTAMGRTGKLFCYEHYEIVPDAMTLAKSLGSGFPIGAIIIGESFTGYLARGQHGSTFSGNHLACAVAYETLRIIHGRELMQNVVALSEYFFRRLRLWAQDFEFIKDVRGMGLHIGMELTDGGPEFVVAALEKGLIINCTAGNTIRIMPPLNLSLERAADGLDIVEKLLQSRASR